jgi:hypothetical protein
MALAGLDVMRDRSLRENIGTEYASQVPAEVRDLVQSLV